MAIFLQHGERLWFDRFLIEKNGLDTVFKNYWTVSNLSFISKVTERAVFLQIDNHMKKHDLYPSLQSAYRKDHGTETALLKVTNDILMEMNSQHGVYLCYLTWALPLTLMIIMFCWVDFKLWNFCYLSARGQRVSIPGALSDSIPFDWGVPQRSCLGPLLYIIYSSKLFNIIERHLPNSHCYADDSQIYFSFNPSDLSSQLDAITAMQNCIDDICS